MRVPLLSRPSRVRGSAVLATLLVGAVVLTGCSTSATDTASTTDAGASDGSFPVTIESALGSVTLDEAPERIATWGWSTQDAVLALGIVPVAMPKNVYGGNADGVLPWDAEKIEELGGETPQLLSGGDTGEVPFEEFVEADPDVILAPYSGLTQEDYDTLSKIAPVVAYPDKPWSLPWQDQLTTVATALGKTAEAETLLTDVDSQIAELASANPVLADKSFIYVSALEADKLNIFRSSDPRVDLLTQLGMAVSPNVEDLDADPSAGTYFYQLSYENLSKIDADLIVGYFDNQASVDTFLADPLVAAMPAIQEGRFAPVVGESFVMASSAPTVVSIPWMLDQYVPQLAAAAENVN
ncbi:iron-siderophore ABC transporter substrate-binding protein [Agreia sp. PsM10]|uniref:iron-siderophore ABC transporter substrate-binding protein n=1 Tax=Agreia sp. PsM10 TaxID=3030533 RepID=UPI00263BCA76|nr:iron-siderophore ABC transporter substrate-binding protein [Agreia sp. PsM10]MDN4639859.1 iron-siderophore ABC transporter substrate-binding protein [Agreia sp. PsM10]